MYRRIYPCTDSLKCVGTKNELLVDVPIIVSNFGKLEHTATDFLIERALNRWSGSSGKRLSANSINALASDIISFLNYADAIGRPWLEFERGDDTSPARLIGFANAMETGSWSRRARPIVLKTVARRLKAAQDVLAYAAERGLRSPFKFSPVLGYGIRKWSGSHRITFPTSAELSAWFSRLRSEDTRKNYLMAMMPFETGLRKEEVTRFPAISVPTIEDIGGNECVYIEVYCGTKGGRVCGDVSLRGKRRTIRVSSKFALQLSAFKNGGSQRVADIKLMRRLNENAIDPPELFFNPYTGRCFSRGHLNQIFERHDPPEVMGWRPHLGGHHYACNLLVELISKSTSRTDVQAAMSYEKFGAVASRAISAVQGFLGRERQDTTETYLRWVYGVMIAEGLTL